MTDTRKISLCITNYNRENMLLESFDKVLNDDRIAEIVITDDCSDFKIFDSLTERFTSKKYSKVKLIRNRSNLGCYKNKRQAISLASYEYVIILDSDNIIGKDYLDRIFERPWSADTIFAPEFARPHFDYRGFAGYTLSSGNIRKFTDQKHFTALINTMNYFVNRDEYLRIWEDRSEPWTADTALHNYNWLKAGNKIHVLTGLQYDHRIEHTEHKSHYLEHNRKTGRLFDEVINKIRALR